MHRGVQSPSAKVTSTPLPSCLSSWDSHIAQDSVGQETEDWENCAIRSLTEASQIKMEEKCQSLSNPVFPRYLIFLYLPETVKEMNLWNVTLTTSEWRNWNSNLQHNEASREGHYHQLVPQCMLCSVRLKLLNTTMKLPTLSVSSSQISVSGINSQGLSCMHTSLCPMLTTGLTEKALEEKKDVDITALATAEQTEPAADAGEDDMCQCKPTKSLPTLKYSQPQAAPNTCLWASSCFIHKLEVEKSKSFPV